MVLLMSITSSLSLLGLAIGIGLVSMFYLFYVAIFNNKEIPRRSRSFESLGTEGQSFWDELVVVKKKDFDVPIFYQNQSLVKDAEMAAATIKRMKLSAHKCRLTLSVSKDDQKIILRSNGYSDNDDTNSENSKLLHALCLLSKISVLFLVFQVKNNLKMDLIKSHLESISLTDHIPAHRYLFCCSPIGKAAIVRQISPVIHVDYDPKVSEMLAPHIRTVVEIGSNATGSSSDGKIIWKTSQSLEEVLSMSLS